MYHYTACGLDNVWLKNGYAEKDTPYGKSVAVVKADDLHRLLADRTVLQKTLMTGKQLRFLRVQMGLSQEGLAQMHGVTAQTVSLWERQRIVVPMANDQLTRIHYLAHVAGNTPLGKAIDRLKTVESLVHQKIVASTTARKGWSSTVADEVAVAA